MQRLFTFVLILVFLPAVLPSQNVTASLNGSIRDSSGAAIPGAALTLTNEETGATRGAPGNPDGYFVFPDLLPGLYTLTAEAAGFKMHRQREIRLSANEIRTVGEIVLEVGAVSEVVTVEASVTPVELSSGEKSDVISGDEIDRLTLRGRDFLDVLRFLPGVVDTNEGREAPGPDSVRSIFINGARENQKNMTVDGVTNLDTGSNNTTHTAPNIDMIAEVKVLTSNYQAEFGRNTGGTITVITKGGTQQYHGSANWFYRHESLNANGYFNNRNGVARPPYRYNIGSWSVGGPVFPRNRKTSRFFFFFSQEFQRQKLNYPTRTVRVPTELERVGDFSQTFDTNGRLITVNDPLTGRQFPGNMVPRERIHPTGQAILKMFPLPNFVDPEPSRRFQWNYIVTQSSPYPRRQETARIDFNPSPRWQAYLRYTQAADSQNPPYNVWVNGSVNYDLVPINFKQPGRGLTLNVTRAVGATFMNQFIFGYSMNRLAYFPAEPDRVTRAGLNLPITQWRPDLNPAGFIPNMTFGGVSNYANPSLSNGIPYKNVNHIFSFVENLSKVHGKHSLKAGIYVERTRKDQVSSVPTRGSIAFDNDTNNPLNTRFAYSNAILGVVDAYTEATSRPYGLYRFTNFESYFQDNWRVNRRLAVDIGMRFYHDPPQADVRGQTSSFVPELYSLASAPVLISPARDTRGVRVGIDPRTGQLFPAGLIGTYAPGSEPAAAMVPGGARGFPMSLYTIPALSFGPRFGFAFDPLGRGTTALRGGIGVFYDRIQGNPTMGLVANPPSVFTPTLFYTTLEDLAASAGSGLLAPSSSITSLFGKGRMPSVLNYSFGLQQALSRSLRMEVSYVGSVSRHLLWQRNINAVPIGARFLPENRDPTNNAVYPTNFLRPYRGYGDIFLFEFGGTGSYNSLQVQFMRRFSRGFHFRGAYTFAKTLGTASSDTARVSPFFAPRQWNYGRLPYDRDHVFTFTYSWPVPSSLLRGRWLHPVVRQWEFSGTTMMSSGEPFTPGFSLVDGADITGTPSESARIVALGNNKFARPERGTFGNAGPGILRGPGINNWDLAVSRNFGLGERRSLQFRGEMYNAANHTQWLNVDRTARFDAAGDQINPLFLTPTAARPARRVQLALKFYW